jgi:hypothetical protein
MRDSNVQLVATKIIGNPTCPHCGTTMRLSSIEPTDDEDWDLRTFECPRCQGVQQFEVKFR